MKYEVVTVPLSKLIVTPNGVVTPLCNNCKTADCTHQVERQIVSVFGINKTMRCLMSGDVPVSVVACQGYTERK